MSKQGFTPVFSEGAAEFLLQLPKRRQQRVIGLARQLAAHPTIRSDYFLHDETGRKIEHLMIEEYVFAYWLDDSIGELRVTDIEDAS